MPLHRVLTYLAASFLGQTIGTSTFTSNQPLNGWYQCSPYTNEAETNTSGLAAECATFAPPLCYPGICEAPSGAPKTIDVFVKRLPASTGDAEMASNVWMINGGPGL
uniref:Carboxypeptidase n=1 Tax=Peronospora matthiolae TaxID=2874970 RepID=A0AAV1TQU2_9STRA